MMSGMPTPSEQVNGPATGLIVTGILAIVLSVLGILINVFGIAVFQGIGGASGSDAAMNMFSGTIGLVSNVLGIGAGIVILMGALKMKRLESHGFAMAASIVALVPCFGCYVVGIPIGIWSLVVLNKPEVKGAFH